MPTGGGKSLCYQLPALVSGQTAVVISPLIALMQDQAMHLKQMGIPAAVLNSMQDTAEQSRLMMNARGGKYRLVYLSPERLAKEETIGWLRGVPVSFFAIYEDHCISEWGHEFRPDYRQLSKVRALFPDKPIAAFTASATRRVRHDILQQLQLCSPHKYIASFHRENLRYLVRECAGYEQNALLARTLANYPNSGVIVYAPTIRRVEEVTDFLVESGVPAISYHGKMDAAKRRNHQERWTSDEVRVVVATIAFGLGINKAGVRAVIHLSLPKSIRAVLPGSWTRRARRPTCRLRAALAAARHGLARALHQPDSGFGRKGPFVAALSRCGRLCGVEALPASGNLRSFWRDSEVDEMR